MLKILQNEMRINDLKGYTIYQLDESIYYGQDMFKCAWSLPNKNLKIELPPPNYLKVAVMGAISSINGDFKFITKKRKYFDADDFISFIKEL